jgi:hypothetical protein
MVNREYRDRFAEVLRHLVSGVTSNDQFEDAGWHLGAKDPALWEIFHLAAWPLYDDMYEHKLQGRYALTLGAKKDLARCILFLKTDLEYEWPNRTGWKSLFRFCRKHPWETCGGDRSVWPFFRRADFALAKKRHPYMTRTADSPAASRCARC